MTTTMLQFTLCILLLTGALGLPFFSEEEANQFLSLKRQTPYLDYLQLTSSQSTLGEQVSEAWTTLKNTGQYYMDLGYSVFSTDTARDHINSYMDMLQQPRAHLKKQRRKPTEIGH
ncbi:uncharacterized protein C3orf85 homolog [Pogona vitticeps]